MNDYGYLKHGEGTNGPFRCERVSIKQDAWPHADRWLAHFEGRWRIVHVKVNRLWIVYQGQKISIQIEGV